MGKSSGDSVPVWLVERSYSDDEQNIIILIYATIDGSQYFRKERALTSFSDTRETPIALDASPENLGTVSDPAIQQQYAAEAQSMAATHRETDTI